jgi:hypothetical protein
VTVTGRDVTGAAQRDAAKRTPTVRLRCPSRWFKLLVADVVKCHDHSGSGNLRLPCTQERGGAAVGAGPGRPRTRHRRSGQAVRAVPRTSRLAEAGPATAHGNRHSTKPPPTWAASSESASRLRIPPVSSREETLKASQWAASSPMAVTRSVVATEIVSVRSITRGSATMTPSMRQRYVESHLHACAYQRRVARRALAGIVTHHIGAGGVGCSTVRGNEGGLGMTLDLGAINWIAVFSADGRLRNLGCGCVRTAAATR